MIQKAFEAITKADIDALVDNQVAESKTLDYKEILPDQTDKGKREFLADISSFANASGGDIIYGLRAAVGDDGKKTGAPERVVPIVGTTADEAKLRLEQIIQNGIAPRLRVQIKEIIGWGADATGFVILVRVHKSFASPHMVTLQGASRFYSRNSAGKYQLDVQELRSAFLATESQAERIKRFRQDRLGKILADETPVPLSSQHRLVLHVIPMGPFLNDERLDLTNYAHLKSVFLPIQPSRYGYRYNLDGFVNIGGQRGSGYDGYCQVLFNGTLETVYADIVTKEKVGQNDLPCIGGKFYEDQVVNAVSGYLRAYQTLGVEPPVIVMLAIVGCRGAYMYGSQRTMDRLSAMGYLHSIDRDVAVLPDVVVETFDTNVRQIMKPVLDATWNACGYPQSPYYGDGGK